MACRNVDFTACNPGMRSLAIVALPDVHASDGLCPSGGNIVAEAADGAESSTADGPGGGERVSFCHDRRAISRASSLRFLVAAI